jgi:O-antigen/teichoic acid export membrane protein
MSTGRGVILKGISDLAAKGGGLFTLPIIARYAGIDGYGAYNQVNTIVAFTIPFAMLGLGGSMVRFFSIQEWTKEARNQLTRVTLLVILSAGVLSLLMTETASTLNRLFLNSEQGPKLFRWGAPLILVGAIELLLLEFLRSRQRIVLFSLLQLIETCMIVGATFALLPLGYGLVELLQATLVIKLGTTGAVFVGFWAWDQPVPDQKRQNELSLWRMIRFGIPVAIAGLGLWMMNLGDRLVIGHFLTPEALGRYGAIYALSSLLIGVNSPLNLPLYPRLVRAIAARNSEDVEREVRTFHRYATLLLVPSAIFLITIMGPLLLLMGGKAFHVDVLLVAMIVVAVFLDQWNAVAQYTLLCADRVTFTRNIWLMVGALNVAANVFAVPIFGLHGAAFVTLATFLLLETIFFLKARQFVPLGSFYCFDIAWKAAICSLVGTGIIAVVRGNVELAITKLSIVAFAIIFGVTYLLLMILLREIGRSDFRLLGKALYIVR